MQRLEGQLRAQDGCSIPVAGEDTTHLYCWIGLEGEGRQCQSEEGRPGTAFIVARNYYRVISPARSRRRPACAPHFHCQPRARSDRGIGSIHYLVLVRI